MVSPCPPVANFVPSGWMSTENMGLPVKHQSQSNVIYQSFLKIHRHRPTDTVNWCCKNRQKTIENRRIIVQGQNIIRKMFQNNPGTSQWPQCFFIRLQSWMENSSTFQGFSTAKPENVNNLNCFFLFWFCWWLWISSTRVWFIHKGTNLWDSLKLLRQCI